MHHTHTNIFPYLTDWMSNPFDRVVCGDFSGKSHFSTSYSNSPLRSFCAIDPTSSENSRQAGDRTKSPVPYLAINSRQEDAWLNKSESAAMATNLNLFFFFAGPESRPTGWCWRGRRRRTTKLVSHTHKTTQHCARVSEAGSFCFDICTDLCWHATPYNAMASGLGQKKGHALNSIMEWKRGKKVLSLFSKSQHMALWCVALQSFSFFLFVQQLWPENLCWLWWGRIWRSIPGPGPGCRKIWIPNEMEELDSFPRRKPQILRHLCCARRAIVSHLLLYDARGLSNAHTLTRLFQVLVVECVCVRLLHLNAETRISWRCFQDRSWHELWWSLCSWLRLEQTQLLTCTS